jgi:tetratricopeptide (TPR) repeat protein
LGGGKGGANAYRALNIRRELLVDYQVRALFWLTRDETIELSHHAPDFWAFRHRVIEFNQPADLERLAISTDEITAGDLEIVEKPSGIDLQIDRHRASLDELPHTGDSLEMRLDLLYKLAVLYQSKGEYALSLKSLKQGLEIAGPLAQSERLARFWERLGLAYQGLHRPTSAIRAVRKAIRLLPESAILWISLGEIRLAQGRAEAAQNAFKKALKYSPENPLAWSGLGKVYGLQGRIGSALDAYRKATQLAPQDAVAWFKLGNLYIDLGLITEARETCNHAIRLAPHNALGLVSLGRMYRLGKRIPDAIIAYQQALKIDPQNLSARLSLIACYRLMEKDDLAGKQIELARMVIENESEYNRSVFESLCGDPHKAVELLAVALEKQQVGLARLQRDPNLDFIRADPRFQQLLASHAPGLD